MQLNVEKFGDVTVVRLEETLDASNAAEFKNQFSTIVEQSSLKMLFDLTDLKFVDSSGLGVILSCLRKLKATGGDLKLCQMAPSVRALFELVRLHRIFDIAESRAEGVARFAVS